MRWILIALLVANIAVFAWFWRASPGAVPTVVEQSADIPALVLLSEATGSREPASGQPSGDRTDAAPATAAAGACYELGPFPARNDADSFMREFGADFVLSLESRREQVRSNYRVYLPPYPDRAAAQAAFAELNSQLDAAGVDFDSFVITQGELTNGIALGLFSEQRNARNVENRLAALGYDVTISDEPVFQDELWIRAVERDAGVTLNSRWPQMQAGRTWLQRTEKLC